MFVLVPANVGDSVCVATELKLPTASTVVATTVALTLKLPSLSTAWLDMNPL